MKNVIFRGDLVDRQKFPAGGAEPVAVVIFCVNDQRIFANVKFGNFVIVMMAKIQVRLPLLDEAVHRDGLVNRRLRTATDRGENKNKTDQKVLFHGCSCEIFTNVGESLRRE